MTRALIVTHRRSLEAKYGAAAVQKHIAPALAAYAKAVEQRGFPVTVEWLDGLKQATPAATQRAIRARAKGAYYLTLIGAPDVIPHHELDNPVQGDIDDTIPTDLVYACDRAAGRGVKSFLHPVRAVGRIPDIRGERQPGALVEALRAAAQHRPGRLADQLPPLAVAAPSFAVSVGTILEQTFHRDYPVLTVPSATISAAQLKRRVQLVKCHGDDAQPYFSGGDGAGGPIALDSGAVSKSVLRGTVVACGSCYGAELYDPLGSSTAQGSLPIANAYLAAGAAGYYGSTGIAWVGEKTLEGPDILLRNVLVALSRGASLGDALLTAQRGFLRTAGSLDALELKSYAQLILLGDPTATPFQSGRGAPVADEPEHLRERKETQHRAVARTLSVAQPQKRAKKLPKAVALALPKGTRHSYDHQPAQRGKSTSVERTHVVLGGKGAGRKVVHVVRERDGEVISRKRLRRS